MFCNLVSLNQLKFNVMKKIIIKFHRTIRYTDPSGMFKAEMEYGRIGMEIMGKLTTSCDGFPIITTVMGPFEPESIKEIEESLKVDESVSNLVLENEVTLEGVEISITSEQIKMN